MPTVRTAREADAAAIAELLERTFRDAFEAVNLAENMDQHCRASYNATIQAAEIADPTMTTLVSEQANELIGVVQLNWGGAPRCVFANNPGEIQRFYVDKQWHGTGVARKLLDAALKEMRKRSVDQAWLGVWEHNPRAKAFYRKCGFHEAGDHIFMVGTDPQRDIVMVRSMESDFLH